MVRGRPVCVCVRGERLPHHHLAVLPVSTLWLGRLCSIRMVMLHVPVGCGRWLMEWASRMRYVPCSCGCVLRLIACLVAPVPRHRLGYHCLRQWVDCTGEPSTASLCGTWVSDIVAFRGSSCPTSTTKSSQRLVYVFCLGCCWWCFVPSAGRFIYSPQAQR